jgi:opacity protein-like surface antigen
MKKILTALVCAILLSSVVFAGSDKNKNASSDKSKNARVDNSVTVKSKNGGFIAVGYVHDALACRIALSDLLSLEGIFGFREGDGDDAFVAGGRALYILKKYNDFNVYGFGSLNVGYASPDNDGDSSTFIGPSLGAGIEYFIARNLSISAEMGVEANFQKDWNFVSTYSDCLSVFGFRYYLD